MQTPVKKDALTLRYAVLCAKETLTEAEVGELGAIREALVLSHEAILTKATELALNSRGKPNLTPLQRERLRSAGRDFREAVEELRRRQRLH